MQAVAMGGRELAEERLVRASLAIEFDKGVADRILPKLKAFALGDIGRCQHGFHDTAPVVARRTGTGTLAPCRVPRNPRVEGRLRRQPIFNARAAKSTSAELRKLGHIVRRSIQRWLATFGRELTWPWRIRSTKSRPSRPRRPFSTSTLRSKKQSRLIDEAGAAGARLIAFPETWIPGYPWWIWLGAPAWAIMRGFVSRYFDNSLSYDSPQAERLRAAAKRNKMYRRDRAFRARRRKPLHRAMDHRSRRRDDRQAPQAQADPRGADGVRRRGRHRTSRFTISRSAASARLCCWEHLQPLSKYAMYAQNEQVHVAAWPSFSLYDPFAHALGAEVNNAASKIYAVEGSCFVIAPCATVSQAMIEELCDTPEKHQFLHAGGGFAVIYGPDGAPLAAAAAARQRGSPLRRHRSRHDLGREGGGRSRPAIMRGRM